MGKKDLSVMCVPFQKVNVRMFSLLKRVCLSIAQSLITQFCMICWLMMMIGSYRKKAGDQNYRHGITGSSLTEIETNSLQVLHAGLQTFDLFTTTY